MGDNEPELPSLPLPVSCLFQLIPFLDAQSYPLFFLPILDPITGKTQSVAYPSLRDLVYGVWNVLGLTVGCPKMPAPDGYMGDP